MLALQIAVRHKKNSTFKECKKGVTTTPPNGVYVTRDKIKKKREVEIWH